MLAGKLCRLATQFQPYGSPMSFSKLAVALFLTFSIFVSTSANAQQLERIGLKQQWFSHSGIAAGGKLADWYLDVDPNSGTTYFEITGGNYSETISANDLGPNGKPMGIDFGLEMANIKAEVVAARLKSDIGKDVPVSVNQYTLPNSTLYTQTNTGAVRAFDAETGKVRWSVNVGIPSTESLGVVGSGPYVAVLKGNLVYCLDSQTGAILWSHQCESAPTAPPQLDDGQIFVPLLSGRIERFDIENKGFNTVSFVSSRPGPTTSRPAISLKSMCWSNYNGTVSVAARTANRGLPAFELAAEGTVFGSPQYKDGVYYVTSIDSYIYALSEDRGSLLWENSTGFEITQAPFVLGNHVYVINDLNQLSRFDAKTGLVTANWQKPRPNIGAFAGASKNRIYTVDKVGKMTVLDQESGAIMGSASVGTVALLFPNTKNDRIYLLNNAGTIRCYREIASVKPFFHSDEFTAVKPEMNDKDDPNGEKGDRPSPDNPFEGNQDNGDPFGGNTENNDPFGGGDEGNNDKKANDPDDPFGGDPFGGGDEGNNDEEANDPDDPFGGDPFGGGDEGNNDEEASDPDDPFGGG